MASRVQVKRPSNTKRDFDALCQDTLGPMSTAIVEMLLYRFLQNGGEGMTGAELKMVQFVIERSYGTATRSIEVVRRDETEIVAERLEAVDETTLRLIAGANAPKPLGDDQAQ